MSPTADGLHADRARFDTAADWHLRLRRDPSVELSADYIAWVADATNARALEAVEAGWCAVGDLATAPELLELRKRALGDIHRAGIRRWFPRRMAIAVAAALVLALAGGGGLYVYWQAPTTYRTDVGERRQVALSDGSRVSMDSSTLLRVRYSKNARMLELEEGRARFDVAHDVTRPFTVTAGNETVVAVGTSFNVEKLGTKVVVTLLQGRVVIKGGAEDAPPVQGKVPDPSISLKAGQELVAAVYTKPRVDAANLQSATAWETGRLIFKDERLAEAVERVNRYTEKPITVDPDIASLRISGAFSAGDVGTFVSAVTSYFPVQATVNSDNGIVLQRRS